ncbi:hypothetical protein EQF93_02650 [Helcococcus ovis]|uniref:phage scaffolding protein n=1 Tax=Helcococcus ovis TaxID=72026 RepID=UPI00106F8AF1|nr:phage scaffolding protein [Helcococcus ovis]TFF68355.1 hypothetical protein EQF93_02650 [Helcococcus ovis]WNZ00890.1 phage scaffolding protein [Helcococcus ovis]
MNRTFLKGLGLEQEAIEAIMAEYGNDVNSLKDKVSKLEEDKKSLEDSLKSFEGVDIKKLQEDNENLKNTYENQIRDMKISGAIEKALTNAKAKHSDLLIGKFDKGKIKITKDGNIEGIDEQLNSFKETYKDLFTSEVTGKEPNNPEGQGASVKNLFEVGANIE